MENEGGEMDRSSLDFQSSCSDKRDLLSSVQECPHQTVGISLSYMVDTLQTGFGLRLARDNSGGDELSRMYECWSSQRQLCGRTSLLSTLQWAMTEEINFPRSPMTS